MKGVDLQQLAQGLDHCWLQLPGFVLESANSSLEKRALTLDPLFACPVLIAVWPGPPPAQTPLADQGAHRPVVDGEAHLAANSLQQVLWGAVAERAQPPRKPSDRGARSWLPLPIPHHPRRTQVADPEDCPIVNDLHQQVVWRQVPVHDPVEVEVAYCGQEI